MVKCRFVNGTKHGISRSWNSKGQLREQCTYKDGKRYGDYIKYCPNGNILIRCKYRNDELHGLYNRWNSKGQFTEQCKYKDGEIIG